MPTLRECFDQLGKIAIHPHVVLAVLLAGAGVPSLGMPDPQAAQAVAFAESLPLAKLAADRPMEANREEPPASDRSLDAVKEVPLRGFRVESEGIETLFQDPVVQTSALPLLMPATSMTFEALSNTDNFNVFGSRVSPPDPVGDVGPNHYVQIVNLLLRIYDKSGTPLSAPMKISTLFSALGGPCAGRDDGDPIVLYDPLADRWLISQFCTVATPFNHQLIAISQTGDPTDAYFLYDFMMPNNKFNDYPKLGVWPDAYYMTDNQFNQAGTAFLGAGAFAFDRARMLQGDPTAGYIYFDIENGNTNIGGVLPADLDGYQPPPPGTPNYLVYFTADEFLDPAHPFDSLRIFEFRPDFVNPAASTFAERSDSPLLVAPFDPRSPSGRRDIEQPAPATDTHYLDSISDRLMFRLQYRNFGGHESLVVSHTVNVSGVTPTTPAAHQAGVRYYELRRSLPGGAFIVHEQATFAPDAANRWMGSAAMDSGGNLAVGYSVSSLTTFPSIRYAGRLATDPPGGLFQGETTLEAGSGVQLSTTNRWGDYSSMSVDPDDDCTFWYTNEYYTAASAASSTVGWLTRVGRFSFPSCVPVAKGTVQGTVTDALTGLPILAATVRTTSGFSRLTAAAGAYSMVLSAGTHDMEASAPSYGTAAAPGVTVPSSGTVTRHFSLVPVPLLEAAGPGTLVTENCAPGNGQIDPREMVTVSLPIRNVGAAATNDLIAVLLPGGGVMYPGPSQSYGEITPGGPAVARSFSFVADGTCGGTITATLSLQDGATFLGEVSYTFVLGVLNPLAVSRSYSSGDIAVPIPDLSTVEVPISVPDVGVVTAVKVGVRLNHTFDGDLIIALLSPDGTSVTLSNRRGVSGDNFGTGAASCAGTPTIFDDGAATPIASGAAPFAGSFRPDQPLSSFIGLPSAGTWKLRVSDNAGLDVGTIYCVQIEIARRVFACCGVPGTAEIIGTGSSLTEEGCAPPNGTPDPGERVTVQLGMGNAGSGPTTDLVATLLEAGGVVAPSGPESYGVVQPGETASRGFSFFASGACGGDVTATLQIQDGPADLGAVSYTFRLGTAVGGVFGPVANPASISVPAGAPTTTSGPASPYPSTITVAGVTGTVSKVTATITWLSHTFPDDIDILLVGPGGQSVLLMSDAGGSPDISGVTLTFDDAGPPLPDSTLITSGTYRPTNYGTGDTLPAPAPGPPYGSVLSVFNGTDPNGTWRLFVFDDAGGDVGSIAGGWSLFFETSNLVCCICDPPLVTIHPGDALGVFGGSAAFTAAATGDPAPTIRWQVDNGTGFADIPGETGSTLNVVNLTLAQHGHHYRAVFTNACDEVASDPATLAVDPASTTSAVSVTPVPRQYSDRVTFQATLSPASILGEAPASSVSFYVGTQLMGAVPLVVEGGVLKGTLASVALVEPVPFGTAPTGQMAPGVRTVRAEFGGVNPNFTVGSPTTSLTINAEDARATYTGARFASTASTTSSTAAVTLAATVQDISATADAAGDSDPGDIRNARVTFVDRDRGNAVLCSAPVGLVSASDTRTGTATCTWTANLGNANSLSATVGVLVGQYYTRNSPIEDAVVTVSKPLASNFITGGGFIVLSSSAGLKAGDPGTKNDFGMNVKYNRNGTNLQGHLNTIIRRTQGGMLRVYQIKANAMTSLSVHVAQGKATFNGKASIQDVTDPFAPISIDGNATLQVVMTDRGEPGSSDTIAITVWDKQGGLWYASKWSGVATVEEVLGGGNLVVR